MDLSKGEFGSFFISNRKGNFVSIGERANMVRFDFVSFFFRIKATTNCNISGDCFEKRKKMAYLFLWGHPNWA